WEVPRLRSVSDLRRQSEDFAGNRPVAKRPQRRNQSWRRGAQLPPSLRETGMARPAMLRCSDSLPFFDIVRMGSGPGGPFRSWRPAPSAMPPPGPAFTGTRVITYDGTDGVVAVLP